MKYIVKVRSREIPEWGATIEKDAPFYITDNIERAKEILRNRFSTYYREKEDSHHNEMYFSHYYSIDRHQTEIYIQFIEAEEI